MSAEKGSPKIHVTEIKETDPQSVLPNVFRKLNELRRIRGLDVTRLAPYQPFALFPEIALRMIRINAAASDENGNPRIVVINTETFGFPTQQIVLEAKWEDGEPTIMINDPSKFPHAQGILPYDTIGAVAVAALEHKIMHAKQDPTQQQEVAEPTMQIRMPESYAPRVN